MKNKLEDEPLTLTDADISSQRHVSRRSILTALGLGLGAAAAGIVGGSAVTAAQARRGCTDTDIGRFQDPPGLGRSCRPRSTRPTGCTDTDRGRNQDPAGFGTRCWV